MERGEGFVLWGWGWDVGGDLACGWVDEGGVGCEEDGWLDGDVESLEEGLGAFVIDVGLDAVVEGFAC